MNIKTIKNFIAILIVTVSFTSAASAFAYVPGVWDPQPRVNMNESAFTKVPNPYDAPVIIQTTPMPTVVPVNQNTTNTSSNTTQTATTTTASNTSVRKVATAARVRNTYSAADYNNQLKPVVTTATNNGYVNNNGLTALSLAGSGSFMPSSIWQWFLVILFILAIIIIVRMLTRPDHNEVNTVTSH